MHFSTVLLILCGVQAALASSTETTVHRWDFDRPGDMEGWHSPSGMKDVAIADGRLRLTSATRDPFIYAPPVEAPLDGCVVRLAMRSCHKADAQVYWTTANDPAWSERQSVSLTMQGPTASPISSAPATQTQAEQPANAPFTVLEFPIGKSADAGRRLTALRVDPCDGIVDEAIEIDYVELVRRNPIVQGRLSFDKHRVSIDEPTNLQLRLDQVDGARDQATYAVHVGDYTLDSVKTTSQPAASIPVRSDRAGVQQQQATVTTGGRSQYDLQASVIVGEGDTLPIVPALRGDRVRLDLVLAADGEHAGAARWMAADASGTWQLGGWLLPFARLIVQRDDGVVVTREPLLAVQTGDPQHVRLEGASPDLPDWHVRIVFELAHAADQQAIAVSATLDAPAGGKLLEFSSPLLRVDRDPAGDLLERSGMFGGLEMLEPGWSSSSERAVGAKFATRWAPHPFKITVPAMAIDAGGLTTSLFWQPLDKWDTRLAMPKAVFASPNFLDGQANHLMALSAPGIGTLSRENEPYAREPYVIAAGRPLTLRCVLHAECDLPICMTAARWCSIFGTQSPPPDAHSDAELPDLIARSYGETMYNVEKNGWTRHWYFPAEPAYVPEIAGFLLAHAARTGDAQWVQRTKIAGRSVIDAAGPLAARLDADQHVRALASQMRPDGTWPFRNTDHMRQQTRQVTNGKYDSLGPDDSTTLGTCAMPAVAILQQAELTGDADLTAKGIKALEAMRQFRVPRGAQVWEVSLETPDIRAAALAVEAFHIGYRLTGDRRYLEDANYWAWTGVPFVYTWRVPLDETAGVLVASRSPNDPSRLPIPLKEAYGQGPPQVTPYGTVPVLGPTFYTINWFGVLVQWCGLEWAQHAIELDADRPDPMLRYIADGVVQSGLQQMMDQPPWVGLYPDSWRLDQNLAQPSLIYPDLILRCRCAQGRLSDWSQPWTRILRDHNGERKWHASGWGKPLELKSPGPAWSATVEFLPGEPNEILLAAIDAPAMIHVDGQRLDPLPAKATRGTQLGWRYDADHRALVARFRQPQPVTQIQVTW